MEQKMHYDFAECRDLAENIRKNETTFTDALKYFHDRVFLSDTGAYYYYKDGNLERDSVESFRRCKMMGFDRKFVQAIEKSTREYKEVLETENYTVDKEKRKINSFRQTYASTLQNVNVTKKGEEYVEFVKKFMLEISANGSKKLYNWLINWCASVVQLKRTKVCPVFVTATEGIGKTTLATIMRSVLGEWNTAHPGAEEMKRFHWQCYGKILVVFEETEGLKNDAGTVSDNLKNMINSDQFPYEEKGIQIKSSLKNINNVIVTSNFPLPNSSGRRYLNITPSTKWLNKYENFEKLNDFTDENIKALYDYFMSVDVSNWNAEKEANALDEDKPNLKAIETMNNVFKYMRDTYAYTKASDEILTKTLYGNYVHATVKAYKKSTFTEKIVELNIHKKRSNGHDYYVINGEELYKEFEKRRLIDPDDFIEADDSNEFAWTEKPDPKVELLEKENASLKLEIEELRKELEKSNICKQITLSLKRQFEKTHKPDVKKDDDEPKLGVKIMTVKAVVKK